MNHRKGYFHVDYRNVSHVLAVGIERELLSDSRDEEWWSVLVLSCLIFVLIEFILQYRQRVLE